MAVVHTGNEGLVESKKFDISNIDFDRLRREFERVQNKNLLLKDLQTLVEQRLAQMLRNNPLRIDYYQRYQEIVDEYNRLQGVDDVFMLGDIALMMNDEYPKGHPQLAQVAIQSAVNLAINLNHGDFSRKFKYNDKGSMATVGRNRAVVDLKHFHLYGRPAWLTWMFIHLISILGMRNKLSVLINWIWCYCTYSTSLRLLLHSNRYPLRSRWGER